MLMSFSSTRSSVGVPFLLLRRYCRSSAAALAIAAAAAAGLGGRRLRPLLPAARADRVRRRLLGAGRPSVSGAFVAADARFGRASSGASATASRRGGVAGLGFAVPRLASAASAAGLLAAFVRRSVPRRCRFCGSRRFASAGLLPFSGRFVALALRASSVGLPSVVAAGVTAWFLIFEMVCQISLTPRPSWPRTALAPDPVLFADGSQPGYLLIVTFQFVDLGDDHQVSTVVELEPLLEFQVHVHPSAAGIQKRNESARLCRFDQVASISSSHSCFCRSGTWRIRSPARSTKWNSVLDPEKIDHLRAARAATGKRQARLADQRIQQARFADVAPAQESNFDGAAVEVPAETVPAALR